MNIFIIVNIFVQFKKTSYQSIVFKREYMCYSYKVPLIEV